jgi:hypothetical protein
MEQVIDKPVIQKVVQPIEDLKPATKPKSVQKVVEQKASPAPVTPKAPPTMPEPVEIAKAEPKKIPSRVNEEKQVKKPVISEEVAQTEIAEEVSTPLADAKERSRQLRQMVAEMEQMFADKMTQ